MGGTFPSLDSVGVPTLWHGMVLSETSHHSLLKLSGRSSTSFGTMHQNIIMPPKRKRAATDAGDCRRNGTGLDGTIYNRPPWRSLPEAGPAAEYRRRTAPLPVPEYRLHRILTRRNVHHLHTLTPEQYADILVFCHRTLTSSTMPKPSTSHPSHSSKCYGTVEQVCRWKLWV